MQAVMTEAELAGFLAREFPQVSGDFRIERLTPEGIEVRLCVAERHLRPGGTVSGPSIFALADVAIVEHTVGMARGQKLKPTFSEPTIWPSSCDSNSRSR